MTADRGHPVFAWFYDTVASRAEARDGTTERRRSLLATATGRVIEVGAGTGLNLPHYPPAVTEVLATEPDPHMLRRLERALDTTRVPVRLQRASAESLPVEDGFADEVVFGLILCSVDDVAVALAEARRVLKPGGALRFYEHVRSKSPRFARWQDRLALPWGFFAAGCHPNRDTVAAIQAAGFEIEQIERFDVAGALLARPHIQGVARAPR